MLKRTLLALTCVAVLCAAGFGFATKAEAGHGCGYGYRSHYYPSYYSNYGSYYDGYDYGSRLSYYRAHEHRYHRHHDHYPHHHRHHHDSGVHFSIGF